MKTHGEEEYDKTHKFKVYANRLLLPVSKRHLKIFQNSFLEKLREFNVGEREIPSIADFLIFSELMILNTLSIDMKKYGKILDYVLRFKDEVPVVKEIFYQEIGKYCEENNMKYFLDMEAGQISDDPNL